MGRFWVILSAVTSLAIVGCGELPARARLQSARQSLIGSPEVLEFETVARRRELFREIALSSQNEAGQKVDQYVLFPMSQGGRWIASPGFDPKEDLLSVPPSLGNTFNFSSRPAEAWSDERRAPLQGLSEREVVDLVAQNLLGLWKIHASGVVQVERALGAPYAAAYVDGILKINPVFLYLAASTALTSAGS